MLGFKKVLNKDLLFMARKSFRILFINLTPAKLGVLIKNSIECF